MLRIKTESEFYETIGRLMRRARKQNNTSPYWLARNMHVGWSLYQAFERAMAPISARLDTIRHSPAYLGISQASNHVGE